jgi:hypothetical protein
MEGIAAGSEWSAEAVNADRIARGIEPPYKP